MYVRDQQYFVAGSSLDRRRLQNDQSLLCLYYRTFQFQFVLNVFLFRFLQHGSKAASLAVAEQYVQAFSNLAKTNNTLLLPEKTGDIGSMVAQVR